MDLTLLALSVLAIITLIGGAVLVQSKSECKNSRTWFIAYTAIALAITTASSALISYSSLHKSAIFFCQKPCDYCYLSLGVMWCGPIISLVAIMLAKKFQKSLLSAGVIISGLVISANVIGAILLNERVNLTRDFYLQSGYSSKTNYKPIGP